MEARGALLPWRSDGRRGRSSQGARDLLRGVASVAHDPGLCGPGGGLRLQRRGSDSPARGAGLAPGGGLLGQGHERRRGPLVGAVAQARERAALPCGRGSRGLAGRVARPWPARVVRGVMALQAGAAHPQPRCAAASRPARGLARGSGGRLGWARGARGRGQRFARPSSARRRGSQPVWRARRRPAHVLPTVSARCVLLFQNILQNRHRSFFVCI